MGRKPTPKGWDLRKLPRCPSCGGRIRSPREQKQCPRCKLVKPITEFGHSRARSDHHEGYCSPCRAAMRSSKAQPFGAALPFASVAAFKDGWVCGTFAFQEPLTDVGVVPSRSDPVAHGYVTGDKEPVYAMQLDTCLTNEGDHLPSLRVPHRYAYLAKEPALHRGVRVVAVIERGEPMKMLLIDDEERSFATLVDEALNPEWPQRDEDGSLKVRSWNAVRPWMLGCALRYMGIEPPDVGNEPVEIECPFCHEATATFTSTTITCECLDGWMTADLLLMQKGGVSAAEVYPFLSELEDAYLLGAIPSPVRTDADLMMPAPAKEPV